MSDAVVVENVGKHFRHYRADRPVTLQEAVLHGLRRLHPVDRFWALRNVNFRLAPGRMLGVIGPNGAGKSTLLRLIGGVGRPDEGSIITNGRIGALLELGAGFHPDLTGRENVFVNGVISGLTRREVEQQFSSIVAFAALEDFIDNPLRTYSSGMQMRLAFAIAVHVHPDILLIDEVLAVGDISFQRKCLDRIAEFKAAGCAIILVSHDIGLIRKLCDDALWLRNGTSVAYGDAEVIAGQYVSAMMTETYRRTPAAVHTAVDTDLRINENRFGSLELEITAVRLVGPGGAPVQAIHSGYPLRVEIDYHAEEPIPAPVFGVTITHEDGTICCDISTATASIALPTTRGSGHLALQLERLDLVGGHYYVDVGAYEHNWMYAYDYHWHVYPLTIHDTPGAKGLLRPPYRWEIDDPTTAGVPAQHTHNTERNGHGSSNSRR